MERFVAFRAQIPKNGMTSSPNTFTTFGDGLFSLRPAKDFPVRDRQIVEVDADASINASSS
jgi:hypothetical protein